MRITNAYTNRLLYNKYAWKIKLEIPIEKTLPDVKYITRVQKRLAIIPFAKWLDSNCAGNIRISHFWSRKKIAQKLTKSGEPDKRTVKIKHFCNLVIHITDKKTYLSILNKYSSYIIETMTPANEIHEDLMRQGYIAEVRDTLYNDQYRYKVRFTNIPLGGNGKIIKTIKNHLHDDTLEVQRYDIYPCSNDVYVKDLFDLMIIKLALADFIKRISTIVLTSEIQPT
jgi:hypothetical protein